MTRMTIRTGLLLGTLALLLSAGGCKWFPGVKKAAEEDNPLSRFDHEPHFDYFGEAELECDACHPDGDPSEGIGQLSAGGEVKCHTCHQSPQARAEVALPCRSCHTNMEGVKPLNHGSGWTERHASAAGSALATCGDCHAEADCIACHEQRDPGKPEYHSRNYKFFHSVDARVDPAKCGSCHIQNFCVTCHTYGEPGRRTK